MWFIPREPAYNSVGSAMSFHYLENPFRPYHGSLHRHPYHYPCLIHLDNLSVLETAYTTTNAYLDTSPTGQQPRKDQTPYHEVLRRLCDTLAMAYVLPSPFAECIPFTLNANEAFSHGLMKHMPGWVGEEEGKRWKSSLFLCARSSRDDPIAITLSGNMGGWMCNGSRAPIEVVRDRCSALPFCPRSKEVVGGTQNWDLIP